jgi:tetratricopeptide (TPR) repeat protein
MQHENSILKPPGKTAVLATLNAGKLDVAMQQAQTLLNGAPMDAEVQYIYGLTRLVANEYEEAIPWLEKAVNQIPGNEVFAANLGVAYLRVKDYDNAIRFLEKAIEIKPEYEQARYNLGSAYIENKQADAAIEQYRYLSKKQPDNADYLCALADAVRETGQWQKAIKLYNNALQKDANLVRAHTNMGPLMMHMNQLDQAVDHCKKAIELSPDAMAAHKNLADCYVQMEELEDAMESYADAYETDPESAELCVAIGKVWLEISDHHEASDWYQKALTIDADNIPAQCGIASILRDSGQLPQALELLKPLLGKEPENIEVLISMADTLWEDGDAETALDHLRTVQRIQPQRTALHAKIGQILSSAGDVDGALNEYYTALEQSPSCIPALTGLATSQKAKLEPSYVETMEKLLDNKKLRAGTLASLHSGLAFYYDSKKEHAVAAEHMKKANSFQWQYKSKRGWEYDIKKYEEHITQLIETYTPEYFKKVRDLGNPDETPTFIVAMPRSGTTLTEQILARHSKVLGIGERNFAGQSFNQFTNKGGDQSGEDFSHLRSISKEEIASITHRYLAKLQELKDKAEKPEALRVVDKMPDNYSLVGWILTLFPNAKIIHAKRDVRDVALSCWLTQFGSIRWACHEDHLVQRIKQYERIMDHWHKVIPDRFIEMNYEDMVANQEEESKRLIEYIGLDWDKDCLRFFESDRIVRTASITQVRQPIYKKSVARWKPYQEFIPGLLDPLMPGI